MKYSRRSLSLAIALVAAAIFVGVYRSVPGTSNVTEPNVSTVPTTEARAKLQMSPRLNTVPAPRSDNGNSLPPQRSGSPLRPLLLFMLAFASGWWLRLWIRGDQQLTSRSEVSERPAPIQDQATNESVEPMASTDCEMPVEIPTVIIPAADASPDELDDDLSNTAQIKVLQKKNITKAKIIKALEDVVMENREKWIHWDEAEARMNSQIDELTRELNNAMRQAFQSRSDSDSSVDD